MKLDFAKLTRKLVTCCYPVWVLAVLASVLSASFVVCLDYVGSVIAEVVLHFNDYWYGWWRSLKNLLALTSLSNYRKARTDARS